MNSGDNSNKPSTRNRQDIILLHGAAFMKQDWKTLGILDRFCQYQGIAMTALNLPVLAKHAQLQAVLEVLAANGHKQLIQSLPIAGLVMPSALGLTVGDWIFNGISGNIQKYVTCWIPVAVGLVLQYRASDFASKIASNHWKILAIYGDQDKPRHKSSKLLQNAVNGATIIVKLPG
jgi:hypothetical protein